MTVVQTIITADVEDATATFSCRIDKSAPKDIFTRAEDVEGFQKSLYGDAVKDKETVLKHWAFNAVFNNVQDASRLDGWGDLDRGMVTFYVAPQGIDLGFIEEQVIEVTP